MNADKFFSKAEKLILKLNSRGWNFSELYQIIQTVSQDFYKQAKFFLEFLIEHNVSVEKEPLILNIMKIFPPSQWLETYLAESSANPKKEKKSDNINKNLPNNNNSLQKNEYFSQQISQLHSRGWDSSKLSGIMQSVSVSFYEQAKNFLEFLIEQKASVEQESIVLDLMHNKAFLPKKTLNIEAK